MRALQVIGVGRGHVGQEIQLPILVAQAAQQRHRVGLRLQLVRNAFDDALHLVRREAGAPGNVRHQFGYAHRTAVERGPVAHVAFEESLRPQCGAGLIVRPLGDRTAQQALRLPVKQDARKVEDDLHAVSRASSPAVEPSSPSVSPLAIRGNSALHSDLPSSTPH